VWSEFYSILPRGTERVGFESLVGGALAKVHHGAENVPYQAIEAILWVEELIIGERLD
jgi:hypothetical protein